MKLNFTAPIRPIVTGELGVPKALPTGIYLRVFQRPGLVEPRAADHADMPAGHGRRYLGAMRIAPSSRTLSPLK